MRKIGQFFVVFSEKLNFTEDFRKEGLENSKKINHFGFDRLEKFYS
jgi:hypothetical protein